MKNIQKIMATNSEKYSGLAAALLGMGCMAAVDEIIFHQILAWHHFYDGATTAVALMSDGFLHAAELVAMVGGFFMLFDLRRRNEFKPHFAWAGFFLGLGGFQLFDGTIDHKILRLHQIRYGVENILPYDILWNGCALGLLFLGIALLYRARRLADA